MKTEIHNKYDLNSYKCKCGNSTFEFYLNNYFQGIEQRTYIEFVCLKCGIGRTFELTLKSIQNYLSESILNELEEEVKNEANL